MEGLLAKDRPEPERTRPGEAGVAAGSELTYRWPLEMPTSIPFMLTGRWELFPEGREWGEMGCKI